MRCRALASLLLLALVPAACAPGTATPAPPSLSDAVRTAKLALRVSMARELPWYAALILGDDGMPAVEIAQGDVLYVPIDPSRLNPSAGEVANAGSSAVAVGDICFTIAGEYLPVGESADSLGIEWVFMRAAGSTIYECPVHPPGITILPSQRP